MMIKEKVKTEIKNLRKKKPKRRKNNNKLTILLLKKLNHLKHSDKRVPIIKEMEFMNIS